MFIRVVSFTLESRPTDGANKFPVIITLLGTCSKQFTLLSNVFVQTTSLQIRQILFASPMVAIRAPRGADLVYFVSSLFKLAL